MNEPEPNFPTPELERLLEMLREAQTRADERAMVTHERFNVFTTLLEAHDEVRLHTRFLQCLLDPKGCHDCNDRFLNLFFETLAELNLPPTQESWSVENEVPCGDSGRIDILLKQPRFGIAIENKIYADEQDSQIARYSDFLSGQFDSNARVIYLTLHGEESKTHDGRRYIRISYADHILKWLDKCLRETYDIVPINQALQQYRAVVLKLTGKNLESYMKHIVEFIEKNSDIIRFGDQIRNGIAEVRAKFLDWLVGEIIKELENGGFKVTRHPKRTYVLFLTPPSGNALHDAPFKIWIEYETECTHSLVIEMVTEKFHYESCQEADKKPQVASLGLFERMQKRVDNSFSGDRYFPHTFGGICPTGLFILFRVDDAECLADSLKSQKTKDDAASDVCNSIREYIKQLEKIYTDAKQETNIQP